nr:hypothetical protein [uncultured Cellulosilyticum sp.]
MKKVVMALEKTISLLRSNFTNVCLLVGVTNFLLYLFLVHGIEKLILGIGIVSIITGIVIELNNITKNNRNNRRW